MALPYYKDILELTDAKPLWFDERGVPRYCDFHPLKIADENAQRCLLIEVACAHCATLFKVANTNAECILNKATSVIKCDVLPNAACCKDGPYVPPIVKSVIADYLFDEKIGKWYIAFGRWPYLVTSDEQQQH